MLSILAGTSNEEVLTWLFAGGIQVVIDGLTGLICQLELDLLPRLPLAHCRASAAIRPQGDDVAATQLAIDSRIEQGESRVRPSISSLVGIDQTWFGRSRGWAPIKLPLFQGVRRVEVQRQSVSDMVVLLSS